MRKFNLYFIYGILLLVMNSVCFAANTDKINIIKTTKENVNKQAYATIKMTYPVIQNIPSSKALNQEIKRAMDNIAQALNERLSENQPLNPIPDLPLTVDSNYLDIDYKIFSVTNNIFSIRFSIYTNFYGSAHPLTTFQSLNYDIKQGKVLSLNDIFKSGDYLQFLSTYSKNALTHKLSKAVSTPTQPDAEGIKPIAANFQIWNMTSNGLLLTFPPYQVAAYVFGPQEIVIPYSAIKNRLRSDYQ